MMSLLRKFFKLNANNKEAVCLQVGRDRLCAIFIKAKPVLQIRNCQSFTGDMKVLQDGLRAFVEHHQLQYTDCHVVLALDDYQLMLIEKPKVIESEVREAVQWLVKDLINFSIEEAIIDFFPAPTRSGQPQKIYVVVSRLDRLSALANLVAESGLRLRSIGVAALAIRNVLSALHIVGNSAVLLVKGEENYHILVVKDQLVYLERKLVFNYAGDIEAQRFEQFCNELIVELQRSIEFYQNREKTIPIKVFIDPALGQNQKLVQALEVGLGARIEALDVRKWLGEVQELPLDCRVHCLSVIGTALGLEHN